MSSKPIYDAPRTTSTKSKQYLPYVYLIGWSAHNKWYYGRRTMRGCQPSDLWVEYFTSSKAVKAFRDAHGDPDVIQIRKVFPDNPKACSRWEDRVLRRLRVDKDHRFLNKSINTSKLDPTGKVAVRDAHGNSFWVNTDDPRYLDGEYVPASRGKRSDEARKRASEFTTNTACAKDAITGKKLGRVSLDDPRWKTGEIISSNKGQNAGCPNAKCATTGRVIGPTSKEDPRWKTGEIVGVNKGCQTTQKGYALAKCPISGVRLGLIPSNDPRWKTGEIIGFNNGVSRGLGVPKPKTVCRLFDRREMSSAAFAMWDKRIVLGILNIQTIS